MTGYGQKTIRRAIQAGHLTPVAGTEFQLGGVELERWWQEMEDSDRPLLATSPKHAGEA